MLARRFIRLSGEIADQAILNGLRSFDQDTEISHAFATMHPEAPRPRAYGWRGSLEDARCRTRTYVKLGQTC
jgi:hypothetical protein